MVICPPPLDPTHGSSPRGALKMRCSGLESLIVAAWSLKKGGFSNWTFESAPREALKTKRCFGLDSGIVAAWSLKNMEVFWVGLKDHSRMEP